MGNHPLYCHDALRARPATVAGSLYSMVDGFPVVVPGDEGVVRGVLLEFPDPEAALRRIDPLEGIGGSPSGAATDDYDRVSLEVALLDDGSTALAWCYVATAAQIAGAVRVVGGDWVEAGGRPI